MLGLSILKQAYSLLDEPDKKANADGDEIGLVAVNQIYGELWHRFHDTPFLPLEHLRQKVDLHWRCMPAMAYGTAMLLCLNGEKETAYTRYQALYERAASHIGALPYKRALMTYRGGASE